MIFIKYFNEIGLTYLIAIYNINYQCLAILQAEQILQYLFIVVVSWNCKNIPRIFVITTTTTQNRNY